MRLDGQTRSLTNSATVDLKPGWEKRRLGDRGEVYVKLSHMASHGFAVIENYTDSVVARVTNDRVGCEKFAIRTHYLPSGSRGCNSMTTAAKYRPIAS
ncbi:unnamed protein product [Soboliphyme baturini]|uniref:DUF3553 domain-containing protein n=1 Tax=Soboliphyme baturini TaxID=241478 RepID=A0A183J172_9BILA|nr:unnamed protein product [Soboliphyme baturini]